MVDLDNAKTEDLISLYEDLCQDFGVKKELPAAEQVVEEEVLFAEPKKEEFEKEEKQVIEADKEIKKAIVDSEILDGLTDNTIKKEEKHVEVISEVNEKGVLLIDSNAKEIQPFQYADDDRIKYLSIPSNIEKIGGFAFINCVNLEAVAIETKQEITEDKLKAVFKGCDKLKDILINDKLIER